MRASLGYHGHMNEVSMDGRMPLLYDFDSATTKPLALMLGRLTRYGEVSPLSKEDDDQLCLVGPGDEVRVEFDANALPDLPSGWTRGYVLRAIGYCKDADLFTATGDTVGAPPRKGMRVTPTASMELDPRIPAIGRICKASRHGKPRHTGPIDSSSDNR